MGAGYPAGVLDTAARRLLVAATLRLHVARVLGTGPLDDDLERAAAALRLDDEARADLARTRGLDLDPDYPGTTTSGVEAVHGGTRLVLTCRARYAGVPAALVVTTLVAGRAPRVDAAPPTTTGGHR